jgi:GT2 family glycosyltransferase
MMDSGEAIAILFLSILNLNKIKVAVVILNYNGVNWLKKFLPKFIQFSKKDADLIVIDNGSTDNSVELIHQQFKEIETLTLEKNLGFAGGYNEGLKQLNHKHFIIVNSDIEVTKNWISPIIKLLESDDQIAAVQPKILNYNKKQEFEYAGAAGGFIDIFGYPFCRGRIFYNVEKDLGQYDGDLDIFWSSGACMAIKSKDFKEIGGFDFDFFAHMEEIDLCWRLKNQGKRIMFCSKSLVYHVGGGTLNYNTPKKTFLNYRNNLWMIHKNFSGKSPLWLVILIRIILDQISGFRFIIEGNPKNILQINKAQIGYFKNILKIHKKRNKIKKHPLRKMKGVLNNLLIWEYFVKQKKYFNEI